MDYLEILRRHLRLYLVVIIILNNIVLVGLWAAGLELAHLSPIGLVSCSLIISAIGALAIVYIGSNLILKPIQALRQAILSLSPDGQRTPPPDIQNLKVGRELVASMVGQINQLSSVARQTSAVNETQNHELGRNFIAQNIPLPLLILDPTETIIFANSAAAQYIGIAADQLLGKNVYMVLDMAFPDQNTFDRWLKQAKTANATATASWERVRLGVRDTHPARLFDLAAYYNRDNPDKIETMLVLFDHTKQYSQDEQAISFIALTVHELRTPLTLLRGYIEVFEEELGNSPNVDPDLKSFMQKMRAQAEQLTSFVNNILNVARVDDNQLELHLEKESWPNILKSAVNALSLQAKVRGITIHCRIDTSVPEVGVDRLSVQEVINNLIDNAIKYSGTSKVINIDSHLTKEGLIETTVQDFGVGIPSNVMQNLFTKFYRDHRNRAQIGGTGLGLYLSKAIIDAHGGTLWVRSRPGQGSTFGFTLVPYAKLAEEQKQNGDTDLTRSAHGWIKNHSLYRR